MFSCSHTLKNQKICTRTHVIECLPELVRQFLFFFSLFLFCASCRTSPPTRCRADLRQRAQEGKEKGGGGNRGRRKSVKGGQEVTLQNVKDAKADLLFIESDRQAADRHRWHPRRFCLSASFSFISSQCRLSAPLYSLPSQRK